MRRRVLELRNAVVRHLAVAGLVAGLTLSGGHGAFAQSGDAHAQDQAKSNGNSGQADGSKENQRKTDEFVEAAQALNGPAGNPECVWLGRRVVRLMWLDEFDTSFCQLGLFERFCLSRGDTQ